MPVVAHPGPAAPAAPGVRLEVPDTWEATPPGDALLRVSGPGSQGAEVVVLARQLVVAQERAEPVVEASAAAATATGEVEEPFVVDIADREWHARNVSWDDAGTPVVEVHLATTLAPTAAAARHLLVVGRVRGAGLDDDYDLLQGVLETLAVDEEAGA